MDRGTAARSADVLIIDALGHSSITRTDRYLRSRIDTLDKAFGKLQRRKRIKLVQVPDARHSRCNSRPPFAAVSITP